LVSISFASIQVSGTKTWSVGWGWGSSNNLSSQNYYPGLNLDQSLKASVFGTQYATIVGTSIGIKINGTFNDHEQLYYKLNVDIFKNDYHFLFGDYNHNINKEYLKFGDHLKGIAFKKNGDFNYFLGISKVDGKEKTKTFKGSSLDQTLEFNEDNQYLLNSKGLESKNLDFDFVENYTKVYLQYTDIASLTSYLDEYNMGYLIDFQSTDCTISIQKDGKYQITNFTVIPGNILLLTKSSTEILRDSIKYYINRYNTYKNLSDSEKKTYIDEEQDRNFLKGLRKYVYLKFSYPDKNLSLDFQRTGLYFDLINNNIIPQSVSITTQTSTDIKYALLNNILKLTTPLTEFTVSYRYENSGSNYFLGLNVIPYSEKVYLNGNLLTKNIDYYIDYKSGLLMIFKKIKDTDTIIVNYQVSLDSFYSGEYYNTYVGIGSLSYKNDNFSISLNNLSSFEINTESSTYTIPQMPNNRYNTDLSIKYKNKNFNMQYEGNFVYQDYKDPSKNHAALKMNKAVKIFDYYVISSNFGIFVLKDGEIYHFTTDDGLSSNMINDEYLDNYMLYLATDNGISYINLQDSFSDTLQNVFSKNIYGENNWKYYNTDNGLGTQNINSITSMGTTLYVGEDDGVYKLDKNKFIKIYSGKVKKVRVYNNELFYIKDGDLYKNGKVYEKDVMDIKIHDGSMYIFKNDAVYDFKKNKIQDGYFYDYSDSSTITYYSNSNGVYKKLTLFSTGTYYYICQNIAVGNDILDMSGTSPKHYTMDYTTPYYSSKDKENYKYFQNHLTLNYKILSLELKKDLKDEYAGIGLNYSIKGEKIQLKYYHKWNNPDCKNLLNAYLGNDLFNLQSSINEKKYSLSVNSKYTNKYFYFFNSAKYEDHKIYYKVYGENQKKLLGLIDKLTYDINNKGSSFYTHLKNKYLNSKISLFYDTKLENFFTDSSLQYSLGKINFRSSVNVKYPSTSNNIYIQPKQIIVFTSSLGEIGYSLSLLKDLGNENSIDIYPLNIYYSKSFDKNYIKLSLNTTFYKNKGIIQDSKDIKANFFNKIISFSSEYKDDKYYSKKYLQTTFSQKIGLSKYGKIRYSIRHYISFITDNKDNNISGNIEYSKTYKDKALTFKGIFSVNSKYDFITSKFDYGIYAGADIILSF
jgi:hypothetical protein